MKDRSRKCEQATLPASGNITSSAEYSAGLLPFNWQDGPLTASAGPGAHPASPSRQQAREKAKRTNAISGRHGFPSSASAALCASLGNRLAALTDTAGSMEYALTWSRKATPSGLRIFRLRASGRRTSGAGYSGWPTAQARDGDGRSGQEKRANGQRMNLDDYAMLAGWPTPNVSSGEESAEVWMERRGDDPTMPKMPLAVAAQLAGWPTPMAGSPETEDHHEAGNTDSSRRTVELAGWTTPQANEPTSADRPSRAETGRTTEYLGRQAFLAGWVTPAARDYKGDTQEQIAKGPDVAGGCRLPGCAELASGPPAPSSPAATAAPGASRGTLNPAFSLWLMGYPLTWLLCGLKSVAASRSRRRKSPAEPPSCEGSATA